MTITEFPLVDMAGQTLDQVVDHLIAATPGTVDRDGLRNGLVSAYNMMLKRAQEAAGHDVYLMLGDDEVIRVYAVDAEPSADDPGYARDADDEWAFTLAHEVWEIVPFAGLAADRQVQVGAPVDDLVLVVSTRRGDGWAEVHRQPYDQDVPPDQLDGFEVDATEHGGTPGDVYLVQVVDAEGRPQRSIEVRSLEAADQ